VQEVGPCLDVGGDAGSEAAQLAGQPAVEGGDTVVVEQADAGEHLHGASDAEAVMTQRRKQLREADHVVGSVGGQQHDQGPVDITDDPPGPAPSLGKSNRRRAGRAQGRIGRVGVPASVESGVVAMRCDGQP
jgi:hypothetical protein